MGKGYIQVHLLTANEAKPVTNARITISKNMDEKNDLEALGGKIVVVENN